VREVHDDSREETGFRESQHKARDVELLRGTHEAGEDRDHAPGDHDACYPFAGAPALDDDSAWNFEQHVTDEEDART